MMNKVYRDRTKRNNMTEPLPIISAEQRRIRRELNDASYAMEQRAMYGKPPLNMAERDADEAWAIATDTKIQTLLKEVR